MKKTMSLLFTLAVLVLIMPSGLFAEEKTTTVEKVTTTETVGTVSQFNPDTMIIKTETKSSPTQYHFTKSTTYVDENGDPVSIETVKSGQPVTIYYTKDGEKMTANKVIVRKTTTTIKD